MVATNAALASGGITHCCLRCGLRMFFFERRPIGVVAGALDNVQFDNLLLEQTQAPSGKALRGRREGQRDQFCFRRAVENSPRGGVRVVFAGQHRLEPFLDQLAPGPLDSGDAGVQRRGDPAVAPAFTRIRYVRLQQDARLRQQLGGTLAFANQLVELIAFLRVEPDHVFLDGNLFPGHELPPSLPCRDRDLEIPVMINDGGDSAGMRSRRSKQRASIRKPASSASRPSLPIRPGNGFLPNGRFARSAISPRRSEWEQPSPMRGGMPFSRWSA